MAGTTRLALKPHIPKTQKLLVGRMEMGTVTESPRHLSDPPWRRRDSALPTSRTLPVVKRHLSPAPTRVRLPTANLGSATVKIAKRWPSLTGHLPTLTWIPRRCGNLTVPTPSTLVLSTRFLPTLATAVHPLHELERSLRHIIIRFFGYHLFILFALVLSISISLFCCSPSVNIAGASASGSILYRIIS